MISGYLHRIFLWVSIWILSPVPLTCLTCRYTLIMHSIEVTDGMIRSLHYRIWKLGWFHFRVCGHGLRRGWEQSHATEVHRIPRLFSRSSYPSSSWTKRPILFDNLSVVIHLYQFSSHCSWKSTIAWNRKKLYNRFHLSRQHYQISTGPSLHLCYSLLLRKEYRILCIKHSTMSFCQHWRPSI